MLSLFASKHETVTLLSKRITFCKTGASTSWHSSWYSWHKTKRCRRTRLQIKMERPCLVKTFLELTSLFPVLHFSSVLSWSQTHSNWLKHLSVKHNYRPDMLCCTRGHKIALLFLYVDTTGNRLADKQLQTVQSGCWFHEESHLHLMAQHKKANKLVFRNVSKNHCLENNLTVRPPSTSVLKLLQRLSMWNTSVELVPLNVCVVAAVKNRILQSSNDSASSS